MNKFLGFSYINNSNNKFKIVIYNLNFNRLCS